MTVPLLAPHDSEIDEPLVPVTDGLPGVPGVPGPVPPEHGAPLSVQFDGLPPPAPMKPNVAVAPGASGPAHVGFWNEYRLPDDLRPTGSPMTYLAGGKQYIVVAAGIAPPATRETRAGELVALSLP